jgi:hypothetical protein
VYGTILPAPHRPAGPRALGRRLRRQVGELMDVFTVETPLQLLNAMEARHTLGSSESHLVVFTSPGHSKEAFTRLVRPGDWRAVDFVPVVPYEDLEERLQWRQQWSVRLRAYRGHWRRRGLRRRLDAVARSLGRVERMFIGNLWVQHQRHLASVVRYRELVLLDDGTQTLQLNERLQGGHAVGPASEVDRPWVAWLIRQLTGMRPADTSRFTWFTAFDLKTRPGDRVLRNDYSYLRSLARDSRRSRDVLFLGCELSHEGLSEEHHREYLGRVRAHFAADQLVYVPHPRERDERVAYVRDVLGIPVCRYDVPIEYQLATSGVRPKVLASFCSSALDNCRIIFGDTLQINALRIEPAHCVCNPTLIRQIYEYYESKQSPSFVVVPL